MEDRFGRTGACFCQPSPSQITGTRTAIASYAVPNKIYVRVVLVGGPVALEVIEEFDPVVCQAMRLEISQRKVESLGYQL